MYEYLVAFTYSGMPATRVLVSLGEEAFDAVRKQDKPVFLSIGYSTCHWCHIRKSMLLKTA